MELEEKYKDYINVHQTFFTLFVEQEFFKEIDDTLKEIDGDLLKIGKAFRSNLASVISILNIPVLLSTIRTRQYVFQKILTQEIILNSPMPNLGKLDETKLAEDMKVSRNLAYKLANDKYLEKISSKEGALEFWQLSFQFLLDCLGSNSDLSLAAAQLIRQGLVSLWTSFEVLSRDFTVFYLNNHPESFKEFGLKSLPTEILERYDFKIEDKLGEIYAEMHDWSNLNTIIRTFSVIQIKNTELQKKIGNSQLWKLNQRRHLIVHKSSIVDKKYSNSTDDTFKIGQILQVTPADLKKDLVFIKELALMILKTNNYGA